MTLKQKPTTERRLVGMETEREIVDKREHGIRLWGCSACGWTRPRLELDDRTNFLTAFEAHICADHPRTHESVSEVRERFLREASRR